MRQSTLFLFLIAAASCLAAPSPRIRVRIYDYTRISQPELNRATSEATQRLAEAGIASEWVPCQMHSRPVADPRCEKSITPSDFVMNILPRGMAARFKQPANALAFTAITPESPQNWETWVFYDAVRTLGERDASTGAILGGVMAHELGHLLRASDGHSESGVMLASWSPQQVDELEHGRFRFTSEAMARLRAGFDRRWDLLNDDESRAAENRATLPAQGH
jgi:hypothetical protein